jgi:hypothetical protein
MPDGLFPLVTTQNRLAPCCFAAAAASTILFLSARGYTGEFVMLLADCAQNEQSSGQAPDLAFTIEHRSTLFPLNFRLNACAD